MAPGGGTWPPLFIPPSPHDYMPHFPNPEITSFLLTHYFDHSSIHWIWPIVHRPVFDTCYTSFVAGTNPQSLDFVALLAIILATSLQYLPESSQDVRTIIHRL